MQINLTLEREPKNTVRFGEDKGDQPSDHPSYSVAGTLYVQKAAHIELGARQRIAVNIEGRE